MNWQQVGTTPEGLPVWAAPVGEQPPEPPFRLPVEFDPDLPDDVFELRDGTHVWRFTIGPTEESGE